MYFSESQYIDVAKIKQGGFSFNCCAECEYAKYFFFKSLFVLWADNNLSMPTHKASRHLLGGGECYLYMITEVCYF